MTGSHPDERVLRPRTVRPGGPDPSEMILRPRTIPALGPPRPIAARDMPADLLPRAPEPTDGLAWRPQTGPVPILVDPDEVVPEPPVVADPGNDLLAAVFEDDWDDVWTTDQASTALATRTDELGTVDRELVTGDLIDRGEWADIFSFTDEVPASTPGSARAPVPAKVEGEDVDEVAEAARPGRMLRNNLFVASGTAVSRATGLIRSLLILRFLIGGLDDAYINANSTPNQIYELILGGILTATLVPLFTDDLEKRGREDGTSAIISTALLALVAVTAVAFIVGPLIILFLGQNSPDVNQADYLSVGIKLALLFAPQVFFYGLMALWAAVLNARHRFLAAAWAPVLNNLVAIATLIVTWRYVGSYPNLDDAVDDPMVVLILGAGTTLGIAVMAIALYPSIRRSGVRIKFAPKLRHPAVQRAIRLSGWTFGYVTANLVAVNIIQFLAEPGTSGPTRYTTAFQFFQLPHGLLAVSIMVTFEPLLGRADVRGDRRTFNSQLLLGYRLIGLLVIPAAVGYFALSRGLDYRTFVAEPGLQRYLDLLPVIAAFAIGLPAFSMYLYSMRAFYAMKNTKTPFLINLFENGVNIATAFLFVRWWGIPGLALSYSVAYIAGAIVAVGVLGRHSPGFEIRSLVGSTTRLLGAAAIMGGSVFGVVGIMAPGTPWMLAVATAAGVAVGAVVYLMSIIAIGIEGIDDMFRRLPGLRRFART